MGKNGKNGNNEFPTTRILLVTALIQLITSIISLIDKLM